MGYRQECKKKKSKKIGDPYVHHDNACQGRQNKDYIQENEEKCRYSLGWKTLKMREKAIARAVESPGMHARMHVGC